MLISTLGYSQIHPTKIIKPIHYDKSIRLDQMKSINDTSYSTKIIKNYFGFNEEFRTAITTGKDPSLQKKYYNNRSSLLTIINNFPGITNLASVAPPDTDGDVGLNYYIQMVNLHTAIYDKEGNIVYGPVTSNTFWDGFDDGTPFDNTNSGDPIVLYDEYSNRWIISQFALPNYPYGPFYELIAISETSDPLGSWYRYAYEFDNMPDYPKFGVWTDGYYFTINQFAPPWTSWAGGGVAVVNRDSMLVGNSADLIFFDLGTAYGSLLPADADGPTPPSTQSAYLAELSINQIYIWGTNINWDNPSSSTCSIVSTIPTSPFNYSNITIDQPGTSTKLMAISDRLMYRLQYRNFGSYEVMLTNHTVNVDGNGKGGVRWYEFRDYGSGWSMYQQGTYSPDDNNRWMGSICMNDDGDIALGYSISSTSTYPSINLVGQNSESTGTNMMDIVETNVLDGSSSQTGISRWGDYSMMSVDPSDNNSFWYTTEASNGGWNWYTQIIHFEFAIVTDPPNVDFESDDQNPIINETVKFYDLSTNVPNTWNWSFSPSTITYVNGTNSTVKNPEIQFNNTGLYTVTLTASNDIGEDSETKIDYIYVIDCSEMINQFPYTENFDSWTESEPEMSCTSDGSVLFDDCWENDNGDYIDWDIISGHTASGETGPNDDITGGGKYIYTESSNCFNHSGSIKTPLFDISELSDIEITFWYNMYGSNMGTLSVDMSNNGGNWIEIWSISGQQSNNPDDWKECILDLSIYDIENTLQFKFNATTGNGWHSDIAIDEFTIKSASSTKWIGTTSEWETPSNWTNGVPNNTKNTIIQSGYVYPKISINNANTKNLIIQNNMSIFIGNPPSNNYSLIVNGNIDINSTNGLIINPMSDVTIIGETLLESNKSIIIKSNEYGTGSFIDNGTINYLNNATAEIQIWVHNNNSPGSYYLHQVGLPVSDENFENQYGINGVYLESYDLASHGTYAYLYDESTDTWQNIWPYDFPIPTTTGIILSTLDSTNWTISTDGKLITGDITENGLTYTQDGVQINVGYMTNNLNGYNLISNPYPSSISFDNLYYNSTSINNVIYIWNGEYGNYGEYTVGGPGTLNVTENIQVGQSFFVQSIIPNPSITFTNSIRQHGNSQFLNPDSIQNTIYITTNGNNFTDQCVIFFNDNDYDTKKWFGLTESTEMWIEPENTIKTLPDNEYPLDPYNIPLYFKSGKDTTYTITINIDNFLFEWDIILEDKYNNINYDILNNNTYEFTSSTNDDYYNRFVLHLLPDITNINNDNINDNKIYAYNKKVIINYKFNNVIIYDLSGKKIIETGNDTNKIPIYNNGVYIVNVDGISYKIIIN